ncbi:hypothetical protein B0H12DRAFT_1122607 [Mycena haematopus]|nr:hypothetical protein B0H12DRAFT_1122607 [Mycena haematopus]
MVNGYPDLHVNVGDPETCKQRVRRPSWMGEGLQKVRILHARWMGRTIINDRLEGGSKNMAIELKVVVEGLTKGPLRLRERAGCHDWTRLDANFTVLDSRSSTTTYTRCLTLPSVRPPASSASPSCSPPTAVRTSPTPSPLVRSISWKAQATSPDLGTSPYRHLPAYPFLPHRLQWRPSPPS